MTRRSTSRAHARSAATSASRSSPTSNPSCAASPRRGRATPANRSRRPRRNVRTRAPAATASSRARNATIDRPRRPRCSYRCRGFPAASWRGLQAAARNMSTPSASPRCSLPRARRRPGGTATKPRRSPGAGKPTRSRSRSAKCWAGSSPRAPIRSATTSVRASAGSAALRSGRWSSPRTARWCRCSASASAVVEVRASRTAPTRSAGLLRSSIPPGFHGSRRACRVSYARSIPTSTPVR